MTDQLTNFGANVWATALELANARLATEREALDKARAELEADRKEATDLADKLVAEVDSLKERLEANERVAKEADQKIKGLRIQKQTLRVSGAILSKEWMSYVSRWTRNVEMRQKLVKRRLGCQVSLKHTRRKCGLAGSVGASWAIGVTYVYYLGDRDSVTGLADIAIEGGL